jgi:Tfp pilus assembly protein PilX
MRQPAANSNRRQKRAGAVLVAALVCMLVVMTLIGTMLQGTLRARRQMRVERDRRQAELLVDAGLSRAALRLSRDVEYRGESWQLTPEQIVGRGGGLVTIAASRAAADKPWQVHVVAEYPLGGGFSIQRSRTFPVETTQPEP